MRRIARALRPYGIVAIWEPVRQDRAGRIRQIGALLDLFFGFFSEAGTWSSTEVAAWFRDAGLEVAGGGGRRRCGSGGWPGR
jgi:hypothetical protein